MKCPRLTPLTTSLPGERVTRVLDRIVAWRGLPQNLLTDNGPEFTGTALDQWAHRHGVTLQFIAAGKPMQNAYIESFNGKFRDECLNEHWFINVPHARAIIERWRQDYNTERPRRSPRDVWRAPMGAVAGSMQQIHHNRTLLDNCPKKGGRSYPSSETP